MKCVTLLYLLLSTISNSSPLTTWEKLKFNESWHDCLFHKHGGSLLNKFDENFEHEITKSELIPKYEVLDINEQLDEDNVFIFDNRTLTHFRLFSDSKLRKTYYMISNITRKKIEKYVTEGNGTELTDCETAVVQHSVQYNRSDVGVDFTNRRYLSWKYNNESIRLLHQFENRLIMCRDSINHFKIRHVRMYGPVKATLLNIRDQSKCTYEENTFDTGLRLSADGKNDYSIYMEILCCVNCKMNFSWSCDQTIYNVSVTDSIITNVTFHDGFSSHGWKRILVRLPQNVANPNCTLRIKTFTENNDSIIQKFWTVGSRVAIKSIPFAHTHEAASTTITTLATTLKDKDETKIGIPCTCRNERERNDNPASKGHIIIPFINLLLITYISEAV